MNEKQLIQRYFSRPTQHTEVIKSIGDDAAIITIPTGLQLVMTMDTLNQGVHFPENTSAFDVGYKAAAVNISDLAAMGATPMWVTLSLSLPTCDESWLAEFSRGFFTVLTEYHTDLIGGDLNRGPLSITVQAEGTVPAGKALMRSGAQIGDYIFVSGELGTAAVGLQISLHQFVAPDALAENILSALRRPKPQVALGLELRAIASSAIDISDGLIRDLAQICAASQLTATIAMSKLPLNSALLNIIEKEQLAKLALTGGDDYQLCFTVPETELATVAKLAETLSMPLTCIGSITGVANSDQELITVLDFAGEIYREALHGYEHFGKVSI